ncbi:ferredoxin-nitrite reductase [Apostasia shenzhenica]|uniref:Ferredoxin-nitrite reductase n=1 Tax=Apostasia shenzhenica TaxID=1088818 RepID=A0A2H9ZWZ2_9ASPA|nr:ferredoxin-nitrite reductase [Apostasia shenzhenica]
MSAAAAAATTVAGAFSTSTKSLSPKAPVLARTQKSCFFGISLWEEMGRISKRTWRRNGGAGGGERRGLEVTARTAGASKKIEVEVEKPLGLTLGQKPGGGVIISAVDNGGNAAKAGLKAGDQVLYTSSFFGDELWPADKLGFTKTAIQAKPDSVYFVVSRGGDVDVKRLTKRPAPPRFGRNLTEAQKARATHICLDCGYIYIAQKPFAEQPDSYTCPQCRAPKKRFARYDVNTGKPVGGGLLPIGVIVGLVLGITGVGALLVYGLQ